MSWLEERLPEYFSQFDTATARMHALLEALPAAKSVEYGYIQGIGPAQQAAALLCRALLKFSGSEEMRGIALEIQHSRLRELAEVRELRPFLQDITGRARDASSFTQARGLLVKRLGAALDSAEECGSVDRDYAAIMVPLHDYAIRLCELTMKYDLQLVLLPQVRAVRRAHLQTRRSLTLLYPNSR